MKKIVLSMACILGSLLTNAQTGEPNGISKTEKKAVVQLSFNSQEEKNLQIEKIQKLIDLRISKGKPKEELASHYNELAKTKSAIIISKIKTDEK
jgi:hypothetical protein